MADMVAGFALGRPLGRGGMGAVFEARRADHAVPIAVKVLPPGGEPRAMQRLLREGELLTRLNHPNVIRVYEVGVSHGHPYVAMEKLDGVPLSTLLTELIALDSRPSTAVISELARGMARGLLAAHEAGVLHRDIKPSNVVITEAGRVVVLDFGIALEGDVSRLTADGEVAGTPVYLAPEQATGQPLDRRSDVYQFGLILHELCSLKRPFAQMKAFDALTARLREGVPPVRTVAYGVLPALAALTDACLKRERDDRIAGFDEVLAKLAAIPASTAELAALVVAQKPESAAAFVPAAVPAPPPPPEQPAQIGQWALLGRLGTGGMGVVFKARGADGGEAALKVLHPNMLSRDDVVRRFEREIRLVGSLSHPGLVKILDSDVAGAFPWYAMELVRGETLTERLQRDKRLPVDEVYRVTAATVSALAVLHRAGLIHRDIKPSNVMLEAGGRVLLMDLGLAGGEDLTKLTRTGVVLGTPLYLPPEAFDGEATQAGDLYQVGLMLHEMATGEVRPVVDENAGAPRVPTEVASHPHLAAIYRAVLQVDPKLRPQNAGELERMFASPAPRQTATLQAPAGPAPATPANDTTAPDAPPAKPPPRRALAGTRKVAASQVHEFFKPPALPPPAPGAGLTGLRRAGEIAVGVLKYGLVLLTFAISLGILFALPSIFRRFGS